MRKPKTHRYKCTFCGRKSAIKTGTDNGVTTYRCQVCGNWFTRGASGTEKEGDIHEHINTEA